LSFARVDQPLKSEKCELVAMVAPTHTMAQDTLDLVPRLE
jgi:hypothetical protein